jgi:thiol-disulfide isomerase/thioredoxin
VKFVSKKNHTIKIKENSFTSKQFIIMKKNILFILILLALIYSSCKNEAKFGTPSVQPEVVFKNFQSFWAYKNAEIRLYEDFIGLDETSKTISRAEFYKTIATGDYFPIRLTSTDGKTYYKLHKLNPEMDKDIIQTVKNWAITEYDYYLVEGTPLPTYNFVDLDGKVYTKESTKGKIVVLKCWFIKCVPCVAEMPTLNRIKEEYQNRDDILFLSLCMEPHAELKTFMETTKFDYTQIGDQKNYFKNKLHVQSFPTHFVLNKHGMIVKKTNHHEEMAYILKREAEKKG